MHVATIAELRKIHSHENAESFVDLEEEKNLNFFFSYQRTDSDFTRLLVRESVLDKLKKVQEHLTAEHSGMKLMVIEGYRHPFYQEQYFMKELLKLAKTHPQISFDQLLELTHQFVALPSVAGHPTGGAVDVTIFEQDKEIDMGGMIADFQDPAKLPTYTSHISETQSNNRKLLHDLMMLEGFAPFYKEWWHFSYGDREWAAFYDQSHTLYTPINL